jgi:hypothetical protein
VGLINPLVPNLALTKQVANSTPAYVESGDVGSGIIHDIGAAAYTAIGAIGTNTVKASPGVFYGIAVTGTGTTWVATVLDGTNTIATGTLTGAGQFVTAAPSPLGVRCLTSILVVTTGTAGTGNVLWD